MLATRACNHWCMSARVLLTVGAFDVGCSFKRNVHASVIPSRKDPFSSDQGSQTGLGLTSTRLSDRPGTSSADVFALLPHICYQGGRGRGNGSQHIKVIVGETPSEMEGTQKPWSTMTQTGGCVGHDPTNNKLGSFSNPPCRGAQTSMMSALSSDLAHICRQVCVP